MASDIEIGENFQAEVSTTDSTDDLIWFIKEKDDEKKCFDRWNEKYFGFETQLDRIME